MTPHPQQEYIITGEQIHRWEDDLTTIDCEFQTRNNPEPTMISRSLITTIRSRPAHAAPACPHWGIEHSDGIEWVCDKTALSLDAATIRNQTLDEVKAIIRKHYPNVSRSESFEALYNEIHSLRTQQHERGDPR